MPTAADIFGFDPTAFTNAPLQTDGWMRFTDPPEKVFAVLSNHEGITEWLPLLKKSRSHIRGSFRRVKAPSAQPVSLLFQGGLRWSRRWCSGMHPCVTRYDSHGKVFPFQNYLGFMGVEPAENGGGTFIFHEYFDLAGRIEQAVLPHGVVPPMRQALHKLSQNGGEQSTMSSMSKSHNTRLTPRR